MIHIMGGVRLHYAKHNLQLKSFLLEFSIELVQIKVGHGVLKLWIVKLIWRDYCIYYIESV